MNKDHLQAFLERFDELSFIVMRRIVALIKEQVSDDLTTDQHLIMRCIKRKGRATSSELADVFHVNRSAITAIINRLNEKGFIERIPDALDRRVIHLQLTEVGRSVATKGEEKIQKVLEGYFSQLDEQEIAQFLRTFEKIAQIVKDGNE